MSTWIKRLFRIAIIGALTQVMSSPAHAQETLKFEAADGSYSFDYPANFSLAHEFADGTGDVTGVTASTMDNGDVMITFLGPRDPTGEGEGRLSSIVEEFKQSLSVIPAIRLESSTTSTMLGSQAMDVKFLYKLNAERKQVRRYIFAVVNDKVYNFECIYRADKDAEFAPACDLAVSTVALTSAEDGVAGGNEGQATDSGESAVEEGCTLLELNRRSMQVQDLTSELMLKDQSPATIERVQKSFEAVTDISTRAGATPAEQDCTDVDAIAAELKQ